MTQLSEFRREKDRFFALDSQSPLTPDQKSAFIGHKLSKSQRSQA